MKKIVIVLSVLLLIANLVGCNKIVHDEGELMYASTIRWSDMDYTYSPVESIVTKDKLGKELGRIKRTVKEFPTENFQGNDTIKVGTPFYEVQGINTNKAIVVETLINKKVFYILYVNLKSTFNQERAINMVIKNHPDFPSSNNKIISKKYPIGGPKGTTATVTFTTKVVESFRDHYEVTLVKDWGITVNGKYVKSFWKYNVTGDTVDLIDSEDNDQLINTIK